MLSLVQVSQIYPISSSEKGIGGVGEVEEMKSPGHGYFPKVEGARRWIVSSLLGWVVGRERTRDCEMSRDSACRKSHRQYDGRKNDERTAAKNLRALG